ncbi:MAG: Hsp20/alpha crystallin family protein [Polyangiaceae bacterium]|nr:Hsp20/alpha crystallin family protein [Polyangiaceae bacterium]
MFSRITPFDRTFALMDEWRRRMDRSFFDLPFVQDGAFDEPASLSDATWPRVQLFDAGARLVLTAEVSGMNANDLQIQLENDVLTISGERKTQIPEGFKAHRRERNSVSFTRSFNLPVKVDPERVAATLKDGVLTLELEKTPEAKPRQIAVRTGN